MTDARTQCVWLLLQLNPELEFDLSILRGDIGHDTCPFPYSLSLSLATSAALGQRQLAMRKCSIFSNNLQAFNQPRLGWLGSLPGIGAKRCSSNRSKPVWQPHVVAAAFDSIIHAISIICRQASAAEAAARCVCLRSLQTDQQCGYLSLSLFLPALSLHSG